ncbi:signal peptidase II [Solwaraspora sp. WMMD406]|uniref:signal peptidase II n=1 Tax=Solwaraspora sp. WMMD406 TaxID=3016095 RepID=UPI002416CCFA|nr:signal peptidase II [Solwaraspora sp. WMMD406]MDG4765349.1 signal peptidase II [Solwaraspora sp. WMMD406]
MSADRNQVAAGHPGGDPVATPSGHDRRVLTVLAAVAVVALLVDLGTKQLALSLLADREPVRLLGGALYLTLIRNSGAAFSLGADYTWVFSLVTLVVIGWIGWLARSLRSVPWAISLGLVLGGALGNFLDRVFRAPGPFLGHVVDMFSLFDPRGQIWPIFNIADSALVTGVILAVGLELTGRQRDGRRLTARERR